MLPFLDTGPSTSRGSELAVMLSADSSIFRSIGSASVGPSTTGAESTSCVSASITLEDPSLAPFLVSLATSFPSPILFDYRSLGDARVA